MTDLDRQSLRMVFDLQICQTPGYAQRGVGHYSRALFQAVASQCERRELFALLGDDLPCAVDVMPLGEQRVLRLPALPAWGTGPDCQGGDRDALNSRAYMAAVQQANADVIHVAHVFPDLNDAVALPCPLLASPGQVVSATLYDLIRSRFADHYLQNPVLHKRYLAQLAQLRQFDLLLAISESTRQDAIDLLGIEPWRVTVIHGGIADDFHPGSDRQAQLAEIQARYRLRQNIVLTVGGDDYRKNLRGMIRGFAALPRQLRARSTLVVICELSADSRRRHIEEARQAGLSADDVLFTGFVSAAELVAFYRTCSVFVFPSLYEGLGLPVLEAMACGAPVLGSNNSSIRELIDREDALFDAEDPESIAAALKTVLADTELAAALRDYGLKRARAFTWQRSADLALQTFDEALTRKRRQGRASVRGGWTPRQRLALVSPLPPCRSGIADYNAQFLPFLARHFLIDLYVDGYRVSDERLAASFRVYDVADFEAVADSYDAILYEFGNSGFHAHMLPLLDRHPGIVDLHDAYHGSLFAYIEHDLGDAGRSVSEMLSAHGPRARRLLTADRESSEALGSAIIDLPCSKRILDSAIGVISHSPFNLRIAREHYPEGWPGPYRIVPQMIHPAPLLSEQARRALRRELGFDEDDFLIATFGHVAWTKCGDRLLEAFLQSRLADDERVSLVFVGALSADEFGARLQKSIKGSGLGGRIRITGFVPEAQYAKYLQITDLAVQLRTASRGGTPRAVLDCLANGVPVAVNNDASYTDYPDDVVIKWAPDPSPAAIAAELEMSYERPEKRQQHASAGRAYVQANHDPAQCAEEYASTIHELVARHQATKAGAWVERFAPHLATCADPQAAAGLAQTWLDGCSPPSFERRRLFIDVSHIAGGDSGTGIQRVVREIVASLYRTPRAGVEPVAVELDDNRLQRADRWLRSQGLLLSRETDQANDPVEFRGGDLLLMLDSSWARYRQFESVFESARRRRVPIVTAVYDLLPLKLDTRYFVEGGKEWFEGWFREAINCSDGLVCISRCVAEDVIEYLSDRDRQGSGTGQSPRVGYWHLGSDFHNCGAEAKTSARLRALKSRPYLLMVGTIEPRKLHALAVSALEKLWDEGYQPALCIAGRKGWMVDDFLDYVGHHPLAGKKLFFIDTPTDAELRQLYRRAAGMLYLSAGEGFGLPIIEAAHHGVPVVCSDLPVFREVAGEYATYVSNQGADELARQLGGWWARRQNGALPDVTGMRRQSWSESAESLLRVILEDNWFWSEEHGVWPDRQM